MSQIIAVTGITGQQGGAVAQKLLDLGFKVRGVTRNTSTPSAAKWANQGVDMVAADMNDVSSLKSAFAGVSSVYLVTQVNMFNSKTEIKHGENAANAAKEAGVSHIVYSSVGNAPNAPEVPHFASKYAVEKHIQEIGLPYTIVRPSFFMENYSPTGQMSFLAPKNGVLKGMIPANIKLQMVAVEDIGKVAGTTLANREKYLNKVIELSGDELTGDEMATVLSKVSGEEFKYSHWPLWRFLLRFFLRDASHMADFFVETGYSADIVKIREEFPEIQSWEQWLRKNNITKQ